MPLEALRAALDTHLATLKNEVRSLPARALRVLGDAALSRALPSAQLVELINRDYADFVKCVPPTAYKRPPHHLKSHTSLA